MRRERAATGFDPVELSDRDSLRAELGYRPDERVCIVTVGGSGVGVPLRNHFEQNFHVHHRLQRHRAGRRMDYDEAADPDGLAKDVADEIGRPVDYLPVERDGAARAAASIAELL